MRDQGCEWGEGRRESSGTYDQVFTFCMRFEYLPHEVQTVMKQNSATELGSHHTACATQFTEQVPGPDGWPD